MDDRAEIYGSKGNTCADLLRGTSLTTYSDAGYGYAVEKAETTVGWTFTMYEESWNYGFPQEMQHFVDCVQRDEQPLVTGEDGRAVLEVIYAAYLSAGTGKAIDLPLADDISVSSRSTSGWGRSSSSQLGTKQERPIPLRRESSFRFWKPTGVACVHRENAGLVANQQSRRPTDGVDWTGKRAGRHVWGSSLVRPLRPSARH